MLGLGFSLGQFPLQSSLTSFDLGHDVHFPSEERLSSNDANTQNQDNRISLLPFPRTNVVQSADWCYAFI